MDRAIKFLLAAIASMMLLFILIILLGIDRGVIATVLVVVGCVYWFHRNPVFQVVPSYRVNAGAGTYAILDLSPGGLRATAIHYMGRPALRITPGSEFDVNSPPGAGETVIVLKDTPQNNRLVYDFAAATRGVNING